MRKLKICSLFVFVAFFVTMQLAMAGKPNITGGPIKKGDEMNEAGADAPRLDSRRPDAPWITEWLVPDGGFMNNGGFAVSAPNDLIDEATKGKLDQPTLSTYEGLLKAKEIGIDFPKKNHMKGAKGEFLVVSFEPGEAGGRNMSSRYGLPDNDNFDTYQIIVIDAPGDMKAIMSPSQDDHAQIWINGEKWFNDSVWTGHPVDVDFDVEIELKAGGNVLLYRCGESGGHDYANLHLDDKTMGKVKIYPDKAKKANAFFNEIAPAFGVAPKGKLPSVWGDVKSINQ
jgi:hypothetical protein